MSELPINKVFLKFLNNVPARDELPNIFNNEKEAEYVFDEIAKNMNEIKLRNINMEDKNVAIPANTEECAFLIDCLMEKMWEKINTREIVNVPLEIRQIYSIASLYQIVYLTILNMDKSQLEYCCEVLDKAILIGCPNGISPNFRNTVEEFQMLLDESIGVVNIAKVPYIEPLPYKFYDCDIAIENCPSVECFNDKYFKCKTPVLLQNIITYWPALDKWRDLSYLTKLSGNRTVPVEIGADYTSHDWTQQLIKFKDFVQHQFGANKSNTIEYLAQHELFDQIPALKEDIRIPDYCCIGDNCEDIDIKVWIGPAGTISPLHQDPKHNILCQVFGKKKIILASPDDTINLYPNVSALSSNTSRIDAENINLTEFPLADKVKFYHLVMQEGECIYIPPKWWHFVKSLTNSFSVSFWWD